MNQGAARAKNTGRPAKGRNRTSGAKLRATPHCPTKVSAITIGPIGPLINVLMASVAQNPIAKPQDRPLSRAPRAKTYWPAATVAKSIASVLAKCASAPSIRLAPKATAAKNAASRPK